MEEELTQESEMPQEIPSRTEQGFDRILTVDDTPDMLAFISDQLRGDYDCCFAKDGAEGINRARAEHPDLIISDIMMPVKDGYQLYRELKSDPKPPPFRLFYSRQRGLYPTRLRVWKRGQTTI